MLNLTTFSPNGRFFLDPFQEFENMTNKMFSQNQLKGFSMDIKDVGDSYQLMADLPGMNKEDIHIDLNGDTMTITAERHSDFEQKDQQGNYVRCERSYGSFSRSFDISGVDTEKISAAYKDGVLTLDLPKKSAQVPQSRRLTIGD